ncbi:MAG: hypothetical protein VKN33_05820, partial [Candidatus Sericytochromatia bacterium]|nr:hypothetical protein [Candidatus Sericytochromatia bacterium]
MEFPLEQGPEHGTGAPTDELWGVGSDENAGLPGADASLDDLLALYQAPPDAAGSPFASLGEPDAYPSFPDFSAGAPAFGDGGLGFGSPGEPLGFASG